MLKLLETLKDSAESTFDSATSRVENVHRLMSRYVGSQANRLRGVSSQPADGQPDASVDPTIYDVIRGVNRELGEFGTDLFEIIDDARARRQRDNGVD